MLPIKTVHTDVLVIGAGLTGISAANAAARHGASVLVVSKSAVNASREIMGFNAAVTPQDSEDLYFGDMLRSGCNINHRGVVRALVREATRRIAFIEGLGFSFDKNEDGTYHAQFPLGCSVPRLVHQQALTGTRVMDLLEADCRQRGVAFASPVVIVDLLTADGAACGAVGIDLSDRTFVAYPAKTVVLATGGGNIRRVSTYPACLTGDGYAIAHRAGAELIDMEFQQYEPCCTVYPESILGCILTTTMMKRGAALTNAGGESVIERHGLSLEALQKDTLAKAMLKEIEDGNGTEHGGLWFDATMLPRRLVVVEHNIFYAPVLAGGVDIMREKAEVAPAAHTTLGGVRINPDCSCNLEGLFAAGETTGGVHGANRLGGCAGAETISMGAIAGDSAAGHARTVDGKPGRAEALAGEMHRRMTARLGRGGMRVDEVRESLRRMLHEKVGLKRNAETLGRARSILAGIAGKAAAAGPDGDIENLIALLQLENMLSVAAMQIETSLLRTESRGVFYRSDFPDRDDVNWEKNIVIRNRNGEMAFAVAECGRE